MKDIIIKWIQTNAVDIRYTLVGMIILNCLIFAMSICFGEVVTLFVNIVRIAMTDIFLFIPAVYLSKCIRSMQ